MDLVIFIAVACFVGGAWAASRWLPDLAPGPVGGLAFFIVCGLFGAALSVLGVNLDYLVRTLESGGFGDRADEVASVLAIMLSDSGTLAGLALIAFLLARRAGVESDAESS